MYFHIGFGGLTFFVAFVSGFISALEVGAVFYVVVSHMDPCNEWIATSAPAPCESAIATRDYTLLLEVKLHP
jgi:hypothetical protein